MTMEIILREDVQHLGKAGEVVKVKDGYARNFLLPQGLAYPATEGNKKRIAFEADRIAKKRAVERDRKSTRLNSSHGYISYAVFCLKKKNRYTHTAKIRH